MGMKKTNNNFLVQGSILAIASIIVRIIGLLYRIPLTKIIGDEGMGYYSSAYLVYNIALILSSFSLPLAVSKLVASRTIKKEYKNSFRIFVSALVFGVIIGLATFLIVFFGADFFAVNVLKSARNAIPLKVLAPTIFIFSVMGVLRGYFQGNGSMIPTSISQVIEQVINAIVSIVASYFLMKEYSLSEDVAAYGAAGGTLGTFIGACTALLFLLFVYMINRPVIRKQLIKDKNIYVDSYPFIAKMLIATIIPVVLSQTVYNVSSILDGVIFQNVLDGQGIGDSSRNALWGIYNTKYITLTHLPVAIASAMATAVVPSIVISKTNGMMTEVKSKINLAVKSSMIVAFPSAAGLTILASPILQLLFGDGRALPASLLQMGSIAVVFYILSTITNGVLQGIDKMQIPVIHSTISLAIHIVLVYVLLAHFKLGVYALIIGNITFPIVVSILNWRYIGKLLGHKQEIKKTFIVPFLSSVIMSIVTWLTYKGLYSLIKRNSISVILSIFVAVIVYVLFLLLFKGITEEELYGLPKGNKLVAIARKLQLLR